MKYYRENKKTEYTMTPHYLSNKTNFAKDNQYFLPDIYTLISKKCLIAYQAPLKLCNISCQLIIVGNFRPFINILPALVLLG